METNYVLTMRVKVQFKIVQMSTMCGFITDSSFEFRSLFRPERFIDQNEVA